MPVVSVPRATLFACTVAVSVADANFPASMDSLHSPQNVSQDIVDYAAIEAGGSSHVAVTTHAHYAHMQLLEDMPPDHIMGQEIDDVEFRQQTMCIAFRTTAGGSNVHVHGINTMWCYWPHS